MPCIDNLWERCTWDFEFVVPRYLEERDDGEAEDEERDGMTWRAAAGAGEEEDDEENKKENSESELDGDGGCS